MIQLGGFSPSLVGVQFWLGEGSECTMEEISIESWSPDGNKEAKHKKEPWPQNLLQAYAPSDQHPVT